MRENAHAAMRRLKGIERRDASQRSDRFERKEDYRITSDSETAMCLACLDGE